MNERPGSCVNCGAAPPPPRVTLPTLLRPPPTPRCATHTPTMCRTHTGTQHTQHPPACSSAWPAAAAAPRGSAAPQARGGTLPCATTGRGSRAARLCVQQGVTGAGGGAGAHTAGRRHRLTVRNPLGRAEMRRESQGQLHSHHRQLLPAAARRGRGSPRSGLASGWTRRRRACVWVWVWVWWWWWGVRVRE